MKNIGRSTALLMIGNTVVELKRQAKPTPIVEKVSAATSIAPTISMVSSGPSEIPASGANGSRIMPWASDCRAPAMIFQVRSRAWAPARPAPP